MRMAIWALIASPPHLSCSVRLDEDVAKMGISGMIPLALQHWAEQTDVWAMLLACAHVLIQALQLVGAAVVARPVALI